MIFLAVLATHTQELLCCAQHENTQKMGGIFPPYLVLYTSKEEKKGTVKADYKTLAETRAAKEM